MTGKESGHHVDPNALEVVPGAQREQLEGWVPELANENERPAVAVLPDVGAGGGAGGILGASGHFFFPLR